jgi:hypothetical protein
MKQKILSALQQFGPLLPVEVASKTGLDSFMAKAYLAELAGENQIKISQEKIADSNIYFLAGQEQQVQIKIAQIHQNHQKTARTYAPVTSSASPEVQAKREAFAQKLAEIESAEQKRRTQQTQVSQQISKQNFQPNQSNLVQMPKPLPELPPRHVPEQRQNEFKPTFDFEKPKFESEKVEPEYEPEATRTFVDEAMDWLRMEEYVILEELSSKKTSVSLIIIANSDFGKLKFFAKIRDKKTITKADLTSVYAGAMEHNCPAVIITNGELAKSADIFLEEKGKVVKVKQL